MNQFIRLAAIAAVGSALAVGSPAQAQVYSNAPAGTILPFGSPDTTSYGQVFNAPGGALQSWSFFNDSNRSDGAQFVVAAWDGTKAFGPALYSSLTGSVAVSGSYFSHTYGGINLGLTTGQNYIAYLTVAGVTSPVSLVVFSGSSTSPLGGGFRYLNSAGVDPLTLSSSWSSFDVRNAQYVASFGIAGAVPEPATWAMMLIGFGGIGYSMRRRRKLEQTRRFA